jgi:IS5 family transposase
MKPQIKQRTLAMIIGFEQYTKKTRRTQFLEEMEQVVPWAKLCALIEPHYPKACNGRPPVGVERMLRIYFLQQWFNLWDPAVEEALHDSVVMRQFVGIDLGREPVPDETTVCKFRHLLEEHGLGGEMLETVNLHLQEQGCGSRRADCGCDHHPRPQLDQEPGAEARSGDAPGEEGQAVVLRDEGARGGDSKTKLIHTALVTPAHVAAATVLPELLHGEETRVWGDQAYRGQSEVIHECAPQAQDCTHRRYRYKDPIDEVERAKNRTKSTVRSKVEHVFGVMKLTFGFVKVRYRGLVKNANRLFATCALVNLFLVRKKLLRARAV